MPIDIFLNGCFGRMGRIIRDIIQADATHADIHIAAGSDLVSGAADFPVYSDPRLCQENFDVVVDFSNPAALASLLDMIKQRNCRAVIGTTGIDQDFQGKIECLAGQTAIFQSANLSLGINLMISLAQKAARKLYPDFDIEILEAHHNQKLDAPSGTALLIARQIDVALNGQMQLVLDRSQVRQKREHNEIGIQAIRGGSIVGEHTVIFAGQEEVLTLHHSAQSRAVFARGALAAIRFIHGKPPGLYSMKDLMKD